MTNQIYERNGRTFIYDREDALVMWVSKADDWMIAEEKAWRENHNGRSLFDIDDNGYALVDEIGLSNAHWDDKETRDEYLDIWMTEKEYECELYRREFCKTE